MKKFLAIAFAATLLLPSCKETEHSSFDRRLRDYAVITIKAPDLRGITDNGKEVLNLYRFAADAVDEIYWKQYFGDKAVLDTISDPSQKEFVAINYGPWDRLDGKSFVDGYADRLPGAGFYPADMTPEEFEAWDNPDKNSPYTLVKRSADGSLRTIWFHDAYSAELERIANYLNAAADITIKPSVAKYLRSKAQALLTDDFYQSGIDWLEMDDSKMDLVIGPDETVDDQLLGIKRSYEAFVLLKNTAKTELFTKILVNHIPDFQKALPCEEQYKTFEPGLGSNIFSCDALYYAGKANAGIKVIAINRPTDADVQKDKGSRTIVLENIIRAKFSSIVGPTGDILLEPAYRAHLSAEAFLWNTVFREVAHGLGVKETINGKGTVAEALGNYAQTFETIKANVVGMFLICQLQQHQELPAIFTKDDALTTFVASIMRSERFGEGSALGRANIVIYNFLREKGALKRNDAGGYSIDFAKMESSLGELSAIVLKTQALGDREFAAAFEEQYSKRLPDYSDDILKLGLENIPVDVRFVFEK